MIAGMSAAVVAGIGIGVLLPTVWIQKRDANEVAREASTKPWRLTTRRAGDDGLEAGTIAEDIPRPAMIQDVTREEV
eukprot:CAMPEP_0174752042 /NCGR_PEP_ID=MMETSP1094-20130205/101164_1 /TAXON_ID=156173 /ORGANISM="Chrysochromulina brevifilum, Strain UTEX LB 985" /LENGTH=76 /DNA_ID=CAMNT_0015957623 /DNA_START=17 /DNA_END=244 /DNA_ORIENTATION=+